MTAADLLALTPLLALGVTAVVVLLTAAFVPGPRVAAALALVGLAATLASLPVALRAAPRHVTPLLVVDGFALFALGLLVAASVAVLLLAWGYLAERSRPEAFYVLLVLATLGAGVLAASAHLAAFFLGLELLSVSLYALIAYTASDERPLEAGLKYLVLAGVSSGFLLFGMALVYAEAGTMELARLGDSSGSSPLVLLALGLILTGIGFKLAVVPFHLWTPDVYEGAPAPVAAFVATVSKGAVVALLLRFVTADGTWEAASVRTALAAIAIASILAGNLLALFQVNVKRLLAYSSIAHLGYLLVAFLAAGAAGREAVAFYLVAYFVTTLGAFGVIAVLSPPSGEAETLESFRGLFWRRPAVAAAFTAMLLSLAGIPLTAGFVGKFLVVAAGVGASLWLPVLVLVAGSAIGLFYYLRVVFALYAPGPQPAAVVALPMAGRLTLAILTVLLIGLGVYPAPLLRLIEAAVAPLA